MYVISFRWRGLYRGGLLRRMLNQTSAKGATSTDGRRESRQDDPPSAPPKPPQDEHGGARDIHPSQN